MSELGEAVDAIMETAQKASHINYDSRGDMEAKNKKLRMISQLLGDIKGYLKEAQKAEKDEAAMLGSIFLTDSRHVSLDEFEDVLVTPGEDVPAGDLAEDIANPPGLLSGGDDTEVS